MKLFLSFSFFLFSFVCLASPSDSVGVKTIKAKKFILHKVESGETLYALSRRYQTSVSSIEGANEIPRGLSVGQVILVPTLSDVQSSVEVVKLHTVEPGQTLYAISRLYKVSVASIKEWNDLSSNELSVGQEIIVAKNVKDAPKVGEKIIESEDTSKQEPKAIVDVVPEKEVAKEKQKKTSYNPQKEVGKVVLGDDVQLNHRFSYCMHPNAPIGTIIVLTCKFNDRVILVKVVGNVPFEDGIILTVNKSVFDSLSIDNISFEAELTYLN